MSHMELTRFLTLLNHTLEHTKEHVEKLKNLAMKAEGAREDRSSRRYSEGGRRDE